MLLTMFDKVNAVRTKSKIFYFPVYLWKILHILEFPLNTIIGVFGQMAKNNK